MIGIISEGHSDRAVIQSILKGVANINRSETQSLRPTYALDETDKANLDESTFSNWSLVKKECEERQLIEEFFAIEGNDYIIVHIDTAEAEEYGINKPVKDANYCEDLRNMVVMKIQEWLDGNFLDKLIFAIAIEEIEAWLLTIYEKRNSAKSASPKEKLHRILKQKGVKDRAANHPNYLELSRPFLRWKDVVKEKYLDFNCSLKKFSEDVQQIRLGDDDEHEIDSISSPPAIA